MTTRRTFLKSSGSAAVGIGLVSSLSSTMASCAASNKVNVGLIGCKGQGFSDLKAFLENPEVECIALCDIDDGVLNERAADVEKIRGKKPANLYKDWRKLIENKDIDVVIVGTPDHWHCLQMVAACEAGKDVYCEKPLGRSIEECNIMVKAAQKHKTIVQVGQWQRSDPHWQSAVDFIRSGKLGKIRLVRVFSYQGWCPSIPVLADEPVPAGVDYDMWLGPATSRPFNRNRFHFTFRWFWDYAGGLMTDWGVHCIDYGLLGMDSKFPKSAVAVGGKYAYPDGAHETPDTLATVYEFDGYNMIWEHAQSINNGPYGRDHGISFIGNNGTLVLDRGGWEVIPDSKRMEAIRLQPNKGNGLDFHMRNFIDVVKSRNMSDLKCSIQAGAHVATVCQMGNISYKTGDKVSWDPAKSRFNEEKANALLSASYNNGYQLPKV